MVHSQIAAALVGLGCPQDKSMEMAAQLDKRARQLSRKTGRTYDEALLHLLNLLKQGWAAKEKGIDGSSVAWAGSSHKTECTKPRTNQ